MTKVGEVFVPGGLPSITYNPRADLRLEEQVQDYLDERHKILSLSGPTKCGKTVLLKRIVPEESIWISGGSVAAANEFWSSAADKLDLFDEESNTTGTQESQGADAEGGASIGLPGIGSIGGKGRLTEQTGSSSGRTVGRKRPLVNVVGDALRERLVPVVVDDFHYLPSKVQLEVVRGLKELVFEGVPVIFASVPHRAFDAVRVEREMTGRVQQLPIGFWSDDELAGIAKQGFEALNVQSDQSLIDRLIAEAFQSPHLMQTFCLSLCKASEVRERDEALQALDEPDWESFFQSHASSTSKMAFDLLIKGPRQRSDRLERVLVDGTKTDIYGVVLAAIAHTGPLTALPYTELRGSVKDVLASDPPQRQQVTGVLKHISDIARKNIEGEPVVDYDEEQDTLYISDPFFAYYLRWGTEPPLAAVRPA